MNTKPPDDRNAPLARNLGRFFGALKRGFTEPVDDASQRPRRTVETRRETAEEQRETARGSVTLRRTVIEEVDLPADSQNDASDDRPTGDASDQPSEPPGSGRTRRDDRTEGAP